MSVYSIKGAGREVFAADLDSNRRELTTDAIAMARPFAPELVELAVNMPFILVIRVWDGDRAPDSCLTFAIGDEQSDQAGSAKLSALARRRRRFTSMLDESTITLLIP